MSGLIHIYCGDGKGKTTAALGFVMRACGSDFNVVFVQFLKSQETGELRILRKLKNVAVLRGNIPSKFSWEFTEEEKKAVFDEHNRLFKEAILSIDNSSKTLLVFDEIIGAMSKNLIDTDMVLRFLKKKESGAEIVLTGRNPTDELIAIADYVSDIKKIKHPYDKGIIARKGIEN